MLSCRQFIDYTLILEAGTPRYKKGDNVRIAKLKSAFYIGQTSKVLDTVIRGGNFYYQVNVIKQKGQKGTLWIPQSFLEPVSSITKPPSLSALQEIQMQKDLQKEYFRCNKDSKHFDGEIVTVRIKRINSGEPTPGIVVGMKTAPYGPDSKYFMDHAAVLIKQDEIYCLHLIPVTPKYIEGTGKYAPKARSGSGKWDWTKYIKGWWKV